MANVYDPRSPIQRTMKGAVLVPDLNGTEHLFYPQLPSLAQSYRIATYVLPRVSSIRSPIW
jgi:hypothetical protein